MAYDRDLKESEILAAFRLLFSRDVSADPTALNAIQHEHLKSAYRKKALSTHPDRFASRGEGFQKICADRFIEVSRAYDTLSQYLTLRSQGWQWSLKRPPTAESSGRPAHREAGSRPSGSPSDESSPPKDRAFGGSFWRRGAPRRYLRFAEFLYFYGVIPWRSLVSALAWQRQQRPRLGEIAQKWRWVTASQVESVLQTRRPGERVGEVLVRHGLISRFELQVLLRQQQRFQKPIGLYFVREGMMSEGDVGRYLHRQRQHNEQYATAGFAEGGLR